MPLTDRTPRGILRFGLRLPILLYHLQLGGLLGKRFLLLKHIGRKSGRVFETVIEVLRHDELTGDYFVASGWGNKADWYLNLRRNPNVEIMVCRQILRVQAHFLNEEEAARQLLDYAQQYPLAFRELSYVMTGRHLASDEASCKQLAQSVPAVRFEMAIKGQQDTEVAPG